MDKDMHMDEMVKHREVVLEMLQTYVQTQTSNLTLHHLNVDQFFRLEVDALVTQLTAFVLGEDGGETATSTQVVRHKVKPRWIPKWLWNTIYDEYVTVEVSATPKWTYPHADIQVPDLHNPVRIAIPHSSMQVWGDDYGG